MLYMTWIHPGACQRIILCASWASMVNDPSENDIAGAKTEGDTIHIYRAGCQLIEQ